MAAFPELNSLYSKTLELGNLSFPNWDGGACEPIDPHSVAKGLQLLETLSLFTIPQAVEPRPDGRIQYRWRNDKGDLILEIVPHRDRFIYQFIPLHSIQPTRPQPVSSMTEFVYQVLVPYLLPIKAIVNPIDNRGPIYQETLPNPL